MGRGEGFWKTHTGVKQVSESTRGCIYTVVLMRALAERYQRLRWENVSGYREREVGTGEGCEMDVSG